MAWAFVSQTPFDPIGGEPLNLTVKRCPNNGVEACYLDKFKRLYQQRYRSAFIKGFSSTSNFLVPKIFAALRAAFSSKQEQIINVWPMKPAAGEKILGISLSFHDFYCSEIDSGQYFLRTILPIFAEHFSPQITYFQFSKKLEVYTS